jgi:cytochrome c-type biogenesis protein CcmH
MRLRAAALTLLLCLTLAGPAWAVPPRASLTDIENDVMCVTCHESLAVAQSPQAGEERDFIRQLIGQGQDKQQIEQALVAQYGLSVLAKPPANGFNLTVYILPPVILIVGLGILAYFLPRWRNAARVRRSQPILAGPALSPRDAQRLDEDLRLYDG